MISDAPTLLTGDDVLGDLIEWQTAGRRVALVTLVAIDGATPRPLGAQMAVSHDGSFTGYLSGGCIEQSVAEEATRAINARENRRVRYGKDSPYFDLKLPCGSGLDLYIDQGITDATLADIADHRRNRRPFVHATDLTTGASTIAPADAHAKTHLANGIFHRLHRPSPRVLLVGGGPALGAIAHLIAAAGFELDILSPDEAARTAMHRAGLTSRALVSPSAINVGALDPWTAAVVAFHEHDWEAPVLAEILRTPCFYIGVMGGRQAHANRLAALTDLGIPPNSQSRIRSPIGLIPGAKSRAALAVGILAELVSEAKTAGLLA
jgi:xanthine dehydrogenase accessory factor